MNAVSEMPTEAMRLMAADWVARRHGGLTASEEKDFSAWVGEDPRHASAVAEVESTFARFTAPRKNGQAAAILRDLQDDKTNRRRTHRVYWATASLAAAAALVFVFWPQSPREVSTPPSIVVRPNLQILPDGSRVELNAGAEIAVDYTPAERGVRLLSGEALFSVAKNPLRPFVVHASGVSVKAVGTAFRVRFEPTAVNVLVTEGKVSVEQNAPTATPAAPVFLTAGSQLNLPTATPTTATPEPIAPAQVAATLAWREKRLEFTDTPLSEAVALFNRQNRLQLSLSSPALHDRAITGIFWSDDPEGFVRILENILGLKAQRTGETITLRAP